MDFSINSIQSAILLALVGMVVVAFKEIPSYMWSIIKQYISTTIQVQSENGLLFLITSDFLIEKFPKLSSHLQFSGFERICKDISEGHFYFALDRFTYVFITKSRLQGPQNNVVYDIYIRILGKNKNKFLQEYKDYINKKIPNYEKYTFVERLDQHWGSRSYGDKKSFDDVFFKDKSKLIKILDGFINNNDVYKKHGLHKKIGILLYGDPGTGKSTIAKAIAAYLGYNIKYVNLECTELRSSDANNHVILLEDIDSLVESSRDKTANIDLKKKRPRYNDDMVENMEENSLSDLRKIPLHEVLNYLDGISSPNDVIFIATTNYIDRLDAALIREGRFDYKFNVAALDEELAKEMCDRYEMSYDILNDIKFPIIGVELQKRILDKILKIE